MPRGYAERRCSVRTRTAPSASPAWQTRPGAPPSSRRARPRGRGVGRSKKPLNQAPLRARDRASDRPGAGRIAPRRSSRARSSATVSSSASPPSSRPAVSWSASWPGALRSPQTLELTDKVLASDEMQSALRHVASSPELRDAIARQTTGLADEVVVGLRASAARLDDRAEQVLHRPPRSERSPYGGIATRAIALATDGLLTVVMFMSIVGIAGLIGSLVGGLRLRSGSWAFCSARAGCCGGRLLRSLLEHGGSDTRHEVAERTCARAWRRTPVDRSFAPAPRRARPRDRAAVRAGFLPVLFTDRRRGLPDFLAGTVVVYD